MSAGFFITAKNKLGLHIQSDGTSSDFDSDEEREREKHERMLARRKPDPLKQVFKDSVNENAELPSPQQSIQTARLKKQKEEKIVETEIDWNTYIPAAKGSGLISKIAPPTEDQREQMFKFRCERKYKFSMKPQSRDNNSIDDQEFAILHDGMVKGKGLGRRIERNGRYPDDFWKNSGGGSRRKGKWTGKGIGSKPYVYGKGLSKLDMGRHHITDHSRELPFAIRKDAGLLDKQEESTVDSGNGTRGQVVEVREATPPPPSLEDLLGPGGLP